MDAATRDLVRRRAGDGCEYCHMPQRAMPVIPFHVDHVVATQHREDDDPGNLALACDRCNLHKGPNLSSIDAKSGAIVPLFQPRAQAWHEHFALRGPVIVGRTATGRATVRLLQMNVSKRIELRHSLIADGIELA